MVVIGSGFIGCEIASSRRARGHRVDLFSDESAPNAARLGEEPAKIIRQWLADDGVALHFGSPVEAIEPASPDVSVRAGKIRVTAEMVVMAAGVSPHTELAAQAGVTVSEGAIAASAAMRTPRDGLLAAGDVCLAENLSAGRALRVEHWGDALDQGEVAGQTAAGIRAGWDSVPGFWSTIGRRTLKYAAWGDGYDQMRLGRNGRGR